MPLTVALAPLARPVVRALQCLGHFAGYILVGIDRHAVAGELHQVVGIVVVAMGVGDEDRRRGGQALKTVLGRIDVEDLVAEAEREARMHDGVDADITGGGGERFDGSLGKGGANGSNERQGGKPGEYGATLQGNSP